MNRLASFGSWRWRSVALMSLGWLLAYGFWLVSSVRSTAEDLAKMCAADGWGCNLLVTPDWYLWFFWFGPPVLVLIAKWWFGRRAARAA